MKLAVGLLAFAAAASTTPDLPFRWWAAEAPPPPRPGCGAWQPERFAGVKDALSSHVSKLRPAVSIA